MLQAVPREILPTPPTHLSKSASEIKKYETRVGQFTMLIPIWLPSGKTSRKWDMKKESFVPLSHVLWHWKMKDSGSQIKKLKQRKSQQAPSGCSHLLAIKGMCHLAPPTCPTNDPPPFLATGKIVAGKFTQTFGSGNLQTLWLLPGWLNFVFSGPGMVMCVCRVFVSVWLMAQKDFKLFYCQSCKVSAAASFMRCVNSTFYWRIIQLKDWIVW